MTGLSWTHTSPAQQVVVGSGAVDALLEVVRALGMRRVLVVTTPGRLASEPGQRVLARLGRSLAGTSTVVEPLVPAPSVQRGVADLRSAGADGILSLGGGAAIDTAKALAFFAEQEAGTPSSGFADRPALPHIAVPTTLVGAAFTASFSMLDPHTRRSNVAGGATTVPSAVLADLDPIADAPIEEVLRGMAAALGQGIDAVTTAAASPEARALATAGVAHLADAVQGVLAEPGDPTVRQPALDGSVLCGRAVQSVGDGLQRALVRLLGARTGIAHGQAHAALLEHTTRFVVDAVPNPVLAGLVAALGVERTDDPATDVCTGVGAVIERLGVAARLSDLGVTEEDLDAVSRQAPSQRGVQTAPRPIGEADVRALLSDAW